MRTGAQAVAVDVVVTRGGGEPVTLLDKQDFQVFEDGKPQAIDLFEEHTVQAGGAASTASAALPPHVYSNQSAAPQADAVNLLLVDNLNTSVGDQEFVHKQILEFLGHLPAGARIAIFTLNTRLRLLQGFTGDPALLRAAIESKGAAPGTTVESRSHDDDLLDKEELSIVGAASNTGGADAEVPLAAISRSQADYTGTLAGRRSSITLAALQQLARAMAGVPGRKNLVWFASSFPITLFPDGSNRQTLANGREIDTAVRATADLLTQAKVAVYPVSAKGIVTDTTMNAESEGQPNGDSFERNPYGQSNANAANTAAMEQLATDTGGQAMYASNRIGDSVAHAIESGSHYYTLVYKPPSAQMDGRFHRIELKLVHAKGKLAYRRGYYADAASTIPLPADPLAALLAHGMPAATQITYQVRVLPLLPQPEANAAVAGGNTKVPQPVARMKVDFVVSAEQVDLEPGPNKTHTGKLEVALVAHDAAGEIANWTGETLAISLNAGDFEKAQKSGMPIHLQLDLPRGQGFLSTGVYDLNGHKAGTLEIPVDSATPQNP